MIWGKLLENLALKLGKIGKFGKNVGKFGAEMGNFRVNLGGILGEFGGIFWQNFGGKFEG